MFKIERVYYTEQDGCCLNFYGRWGITVNGILLGSRSADDDTPLAGFYALETVSCHSGGCTTYVSGSHRLLVVWFDVEGRQ